LLWRDIWSPCRWESVTNNVLFVSDSGERQTYKVEPADFLDIKGNPTVTVFAAGLSFAPNGLYPTRYGSLLMVGFERTGQDHGIYSVDPDGKLTQKANKGL